MKTLYKKVIPCVALFGGMLSPHSVLADTSGSAPVVFYLVRHGKTILNTMDRVQGWADSTLTPDGEEVVKYLGRGIRDAGLKFNAVYSSDLGRARMTARIVLDESEQGHLVIHETPALRETCFGSYEGLDNSRMWADAAHALNYTSVESYFEDVRKDYRKLIEGMEVIKGLELLGLCEDFYDVKKRGQSFIRDIARKMSASGGGNILVTSHGMCLGISLVDIDDFGVIPNITHIENASVSKLVYKDGKFSLESFGDTSYLEKGRSTFDK